MKDLIFTTLALPGKSELDALLLAESIRQFGGNLSDNPIWVLIPISRSLSSSIEERLEHLKVHVLPFNVAPKILEFPFAAKIVAAAFAEKMAVEHTELITFMDGDTLVLQEPTDFLIPTAKALGYRPVHHKLIGSAWDEALDTFWLLIYEICDVPDERIFPMMTHAGEQIRPYFNAGVFVTRPERGLLTQWEETFLKWYQKPQLTAYYEQNQLYPIFIHQAVFTGVLLHNLKKDELFEFNAQINYPLHLHDQIPVDQRPATIDELITARHEDIFDTMDWQQLPITEPLKSWLESQPRVR